MKITSIKQQKKYPGRYSVYIDGEFVFGVSEDGLVRLGLHTGQELSEDELENLREEAEFSKAYERVLNYVSVRPRSEKEITDYMRRKQYTVDTSRKILAKLRDLDLVNDAAFARSWVQWRQSTAPRSRRKLWQELQQKGIDDEAIEDVLADIDEGEQVRTVRALIDKKGHRYDNRQKLMTYLSRQGFPYDVIRKALEYEEDDGEEA